MINGPNWDQDLYIETFRFAAEAHHGALFPGTQLPYIMHIHFVSMEMMAALSAEQCKPESLKYDVNLAICCALLHDVIEDTNITYKEIEEKFGSRVANGVQALSKNKNLEKSLQMSDSLERIQQQPYEVWMVKMADRISNLQAPPEFWTKEKKIKYREEASQILCALGKANSYLASRLQKKIEGYERWI